jgi:transmembrane 9 superfamily protein 2/4
MRHWQCATTFILFVAFSEAFYLPGVIPHDYQDGEDVKLKVNKIDSVRTQLPFAYYELPFCKPDDIRYSAENLGEILRGDRIENSLYRLKMNVEESCKVLCRQTYTADEIAAFAEKVEDEYRVHWIVDNLPAATRYVTGFSADGNTPIYAYERGYAMGFIGGSPIVYNRQAKDGVAYINNHLRLVLKYHTHKVKKNQRNSAKPDCRWTGPHQRWTRWITHCGLRSGAFQRESQIREME